MKLWVDDVREAPEGYIWCKTVSDAKAIIQQFESFVKGGSTNHIELIDLDHDAGEYGPPDYIKLLDWLEETGRKYPIRIHSANAVGVENMRRIIRRNGWKEVF
jgi:hypothetical protein